MNQYQRIRIQEETDRLQARVDEQDLSWKFKGAFALVVGILATTALWYFS